MLEELHIRDIGVIEEVTLELRPGLNVLTGETGAGKTMVVAALELLLGARADSDQVRADASRALVEGRFCPVPEAGAEWVDDEDQDLVVSRELQSSRSRGRLGGRLAPASTLAEVVGQVVEIHGQHDSARLSSASAQRALLDRCGGTELSAALDGYRDAYETWHALREELSTLEDGRRDRAREIDRLTFECEEIEAVAPIAGEDEELDAELARLEHAESLLDAAWAGAGALNADGGARDVLGGAVEALRAVEDVDTTLTALQLRLEGIAAEAQDLGMELERYGDGLTLDPERLDELRDRRMAISRLARKYGADAAAIAAYGAQARAQLTALEGGDDRIGALRDEVASAREAVGGAAEGLRKARRAAADELVEAVERHLADLAMPDAAMQVDIEAIEPGPHGADRVTFLLAANPGQPALPLAKAASGGERSRVALAVRLALADADETPVLVFDEVDAGVGGATALAVGEKLARLASGRQVLCVTHLAQLAAYADAHFVVAKTSTGGQTRASVRGAEGEERLAELARMLSGATDSSAAATHAAELLESARASLGRAQS